MIMAQLKQLSAGSSQIIMMMFRDKNNAPIKADSVHVKGSIFTGTYISENQQKLGVEVVQKGTFLSDRQGAMWVDVYLPIEINDAAQIPWVPAGADEQWIKDYLDKYVKTPAFAATLAALGGASKNLSNVDAKDFEKKAKDGNFAQNDLADVDLAKLKEKGLAAGLADAKNPISPTEFDRMIKQNAAFIALSKTAHPATAGKTNDQTLLDVNGNPMAVQIDYKAGDKQRKELYLGECQAKAFTDVHLRIETNFPNEELLSIGANSCVLIQSVGKDYGVGKALLAFMAFTGYQIKMNNKYYGYNSLNLSRALVFDEPEIDVNNDVMYFGDNTYLSVKTAAKVSISNNQLVVKDNGKDLPVFSLFKKYSRFDTHVLKGKNYKATVKITDKQNSFVVALMKYTGTEAVAPSPELLSINNDQPQFNAGWSIADRLFISEDVVSGIHEATKTFVVPADAVEFAVIIYPTESQTPTDMVLNDFEGDITPWFNRMVVTDSSHISEKYLEYQKDYAKFVVMTPAGDASYRYTYNKTAGNILWALKRVWLWLAIITHGQTPERQTLTKFKEIYWQRRTEL